MPKQLSASINSLDPVVAGILGGAGTLAGGVAGEFVLQPAIAQVNVQFGSLPGIASMLYGVILMLAILLIPQGLLRLGEPRVWRRYTRSVKSRFRRPGSVTQETNKPARASDSTEEFAHDTQL